MMRCKYMEEDIEKIREDSIEEIKEKVRKNPKFLSPVNKERLEYQEKLKFANGNDFTNWMQQVGIMKNHIDVERKRHEKTIKDAGCNTEKEYRDKCARSAGFKDSAEQHRDYYREWTHETGRNFPAEDNPDCPRCFGDFTENLMIQTFEDAIKMSSNNPGYDWTCNRGYKIDNKGACLQYIDGKSPKWLFNIIYNDIADWFILSAWDNRDSLTPLHVWAFHKNDIVRGRKFWRRTGFSVINTPKGLKEFEKYEIINRLEKLKELRNKYKDKGICGIDHV